MTIICYDGKSIAADKRNTWAGGHLTTTKLVQFEGGVLAGCGETAQIIEMVRWIKEGCKIKRFPKNRRDPDRSSSLLLVTPEGCVLQYENAPYPIEIENIFWAIGSGAHYAMAAMHLGCSAEEAVSIACTYDVGCGLGIDLLTVLPAKASKKRLRVAA